MLELNLKKLGFFTRVFLAFTLALVIFSPLLVKNASAAAGINRVINFQGKLVNNPSATNVSNSPYTVVFSLYDQASGGTVLWSETQTVITADGIFRVALGSVTPFPANFNFNWSGLYLGIKVGSDSEMTPRIQLASVPYAFNAQQVAGLTVQDDSGNASTSGTLQVGNSKIVTFKGSSGLTFNDPGASVTISFPTTGTLTLVDTSTSQTLTGKTIGTGGLTFNTTGTDITTTANQNFIVSPNGTGLIGFNTNSPLSSIDLQGNPVTGGTLSIASVSGQTSFAAFVIDNSGSGDLFTASSSGETKFNIARNGNITLTGAVLISGSNGSGQCLTGGSAVKWGTCGGAPPGGYPFFNAGGYIIQNITTEDLLLGGNSTSTAKFAFTGLDTNQTQASFSGQFNLMPNNGYGGNASISAGMVLGAMIGPVIQTTDNKAIIIGGNTTGNINFSPNNTPTINLSPNTLTFVGAGISQINTLNNQHLSINPGGGGFLGINTDGITPVANVDIRGDVGTIAVASVSGKTSYASLVANNDGVGDIFTASASGWTRFTISNSGKVTIGTSTNGLTFDPASGPNYNGSAQPLKTIILSPEYAGATLTASGSATTNGNMTADASPSANFRTYYQWSTTQSSMQDYTVVVRVTLPNDFSSWDSANAMTIDLDTATTNATQNKLDILVYNPTSSTSTPVLMRTANTSTSGYNWRTIAITSSAFTGGAAKWQTSGQTAVIYLKMYAASPGVTQIGDIVLNYYAKF